MMERVMSKKMKKVLVAEALPDLTSVLNMPGGNRQICHSCGREVTEKRTYAIYHEELGVIEACDICNTKWQRKRLEGMVLYASRKQKGRKKKTRTIKDSSEDY